MDVQQASRFAVTPNSKAVAADARAVLLEDPGFGRIFTDHMVTIRWTQGQGWHSHQVGPRQPFTPKVDPDSASSSGTRPASSSRSNRRPPRAPSR